MVHSVKRGTENLLLQNKPWYRLIATLCSSTWRDLENISNRNTRKWNIKFEEVWVEHIKLVSITLLISKHLFEQTNVQGFTKHGVWYSPLLNRHRCRSIEMIKKNTNLKYYSLRNKSYCKNLNNLCVCWLQVLYPNTIIIFNKINRWSIRVCSSAIKFSEVLVNRLEDTKKPWMLQALHPCY